jgi:hypothetical protein
LLVQFILLQASCWSHENHNSQLRSVKGGAALFSLICLSSLPRQKDEQIITHISR